MNVVIIILYVSSNTCKSGMPRRIIWIAKQIMLNELLKCFCGTFMPFGVTMKMIIVILLWVKLIDFHN